MVAVRHVVLPPDQPLCTPSTDPLLLVEFIPLQLAHLQSIAREEAVTILLGALRGFLAIDKRVGVVTPRDTLVGLNEEGHTKVWLSTQLESTVVEEKSDLSEEERVSQLYDIVSQRCREMLLPVILEVEFKERRLNYAGAIRLIEQEPALAHLNKHKYLTPQRINVAEESIPRPVLLPPPPISREIVEVRELKKTHSMSTFSHPEADLSMMSRGRLRHDTHKGLSIISSQATSAQHHPPPQYSALSRSHALIPKQMSTFSLVSAIPADRRRSLGREPREIEVHSIHQEELEDPRDEMPFIAEKDLQKEESSSR